MTPRWGPMVSAVAAKFRGAEHRQLVLQTTDQLGGVARIGLEPFDRGYFTSGGVTDSARVAPDHDVPQRAM